MTDVPLSALLSQTLVAFTIEFDNEFEHRMPHRTTNHGATPGASKAPWLVSMAMWVHCMRHVPEEGIPAGELARRAQMSAASAEGILKRMSRWWGYTYALEFDAGKGPALALSANVLRIASRDGVPVSGLPTLTGIAGMGVENSLTLLERCGLLATGAGRGRLARLTPDGS